MSENLPGYGEAIAQVNEYAQEKIRIGHKPVQAELAYACGRVLAEPLLADRDQPPFARAAHDGYACRVVELCSYESLSVAGSTQAGKLPESALPVGAVWEVTNGAPVPEGADAVVRQERVELQDGKLRLQRGYSLESGKNIVLQGAHAKSGEELLAVRTVLGPAQVALAAACGADVLPVYPRPRVAIITSGDELVPVDHEPGPGQIRNSNAPMLASLVLAVGGDPWVFPTVPDSVTAISSSIRQASLPAAQADLLVFSGGASAGKFDLVETALSKAGAKFFFNGVRMQPGRPAAFGEIQHSAADQMKGFGDLLRSSTMETQRTPLPFMALPGNPVATALTFQLFGVPLLAALCGCPLSGPQFLRARLLEEVKGREGMTRFLPAHCDFHGAEDGLHEVRPISMHGSGDLTALARSNCFIMVPEESEKIRAGSLVHILPH